MAGCGSPVKAPETARSVYARGSPYECEEKRRPGLGLLVSQMEQPCVAQSGYPHRIGALGLRRDVSTLQTDAQSQTQTPSSKLAG
jgi:hypothetical protein